MLTRMTSRSSISECVLSHSSVILGDILMIGIRAEEHSGNERKLHGSVSYRLLGGDIADSSAAALAAMKKFTGGQDKPVQQQGGSMQSGVSSFLLQMAKLISSSSVWQCQKVPK
jgi:hypothetical protein